MSPPILARAAVVLAAAFAVAVLAAWQSESESCTDSVKGLLFGIRDRDPESQLAAASARVEDDCEGTSRLIDSGAVLFERGHPDLGVRLFREATEREPDSFSAWAGLAVVLADRDPRAAAAAREHARALNPFYRPARRD